jgi:ABC-type amino acid transport substrate-binding protein
MVKKFFGNNLVNRSKINTFFLRENKRKLIFIAVAVALLAGLVTLIVVLSNRVNYESAREPLRAKGMISIGLRTDIPGFAQTNKDGGIEGFEADVAAEIVSRLFDENINVQYKAVNSKTGKVFIDQDVLDFSLGAYIQSSEESYLTYSDPYFTDAVVFYVRKGSSITSAEQIDGKKVGVVNSSYAGYEKKLEEFLKGKGMKCTFFYYNAYPDAADALTAGKIDMFAGGREIMQTYTKDMSELPGFVLKHGYCIAIKNNNNDLKKALNDILYKMKNDGTIKKLIKKWNLMDYTDK